MSIETCKRCGAEFDPEKGLMGPNTQVRPRHCVVCQARNLFDGLDLPTPPELLDKYTKHPTLSQRQYQEELNKDSEDT